MLRSRTSRAYFAAGAIVLLLMAASAGYVVRPGDTLSQIAAEHETTTAELAEENQISDPNRIFVGQVIEIPGLEEDQEVTKPENGSASENRTHTIKAGETLSTIAAQYGVSVSELVTLNNIANPSVIFAGAELNLQVSADEEEAGSDSGSDTEGADMVVDEDESDTADRSPQTEASESETASSDDNRSADRESNDEPVQIPVFYTVKSGDTLSQIGKRYQTTIEQLMKSNHLENANYIRIGQDLLVGFKDGEPEDSGTVVMTPNENSLPDLVSTESIPTTTVPEDIPDNSTSDDTNSVSTDDRSASATEAVTAEVAEPANQPTETPDQNNSADEDDSEIPSEVDDSEEVGEEAEDEEEAAWLCPVPRATFSNDWGDPRSGGRLHEGTDLFAPTGTPIYSPVAGLIEQLLSLRGGNQFILRGDDGHTYIGTHLDRFGEYGYVQAGEIIGYVGYTGNANEQSPHLHFEFHPDGGGPINPYPLIKENC